MRPSLVAQSPGSGGSKRAVRWFRSRLVLVTVPLGPSLVRSGSRKPGSWSSRSSCCSSPAWRAKARVCAGSRSPTTSGALPLACGGCGPVASGRSAGVRPTGSDAIRNGTRTSGPLVVSTATPSLSERPQAVLAASGERWARRGFGSKATRAPAAAGRPAKRLSKVARAYLAEGARAPASAALRSAALGATRTTPSPAAAAAPWVGRGAGASVEKASHALPASIATAARPPTSACAWSALSAPCVTRGASCSIASATSGSRVSRSKTTSAEPAGTKASGSALAARFDLSSFPPRSSSTTASTPARSASAASSSGARRRSTAGTVAPTAHPDRVAQRAVP